jgi:hypothetical protein
MSYIDEDYRVPRDNDDPNVLLAIHSRDGNTEGCLKALEEGADLRDQGYLDAKWVPLESAIENGHHKTAQAMIKYYIESPKTTTKIFEDGTNKELTEILTMLCTRPSLKEIDVQNDEFVKAEPEYRNTYPKEEESYTETIRSLIKLGANGGRGWHGGGHSALELAGSSGYSEAVKLILESGVSPKRKTNPEHFPFITAIESNRRNCAETVLSFYKLSELKELKKVATSRQESEWVEVVNAQIRSRVIKKAEDKTKDWEDINL